MIISNRILNPVLNLLLQEYIEMHLPVTKTKNDYSLRAVHPGHQYLETKVTQGATLTNAI